MGMQQVFTIIFKNRKIWYVKTMKLKNLRKTEDNMGYFSNKDEQFG